MSYKYSLLAIQAVLSAFILFHAVPQSNQDSIYRALSLAVLGYWFPSPISATKGEE